MEKLNVIIEKKDTGKELKRFKGYVLGLRKLKKRNKQEKEEK